VTHGNVRVTNWISASRDLKWALEKQKADTPIYEIDLTKVSQTIVDTTKPGVMNGWFWLAKKFAGRASEVLIDTHIPPEAIRGVILPR
jgi:hypothetical protein